MAFMIARETENVRSSEEVENAFRAIAANERPYVTSEELYQVRVSFLISFWGCLSKLYSVYFHSGIFC